MDSFSQSGWAYLVQRGDGSCAGGIQGGEWIAGKLAEIVKGGRGEETGDVKLIAHDGDGIADVNAEGNLGLRGEAAGVLRDADEFAGGLILFFGQIDTDKAGDDVGFGAAGGTDGNGPGLFGAFGGDPPARADGLRGGEVLGIVPCQAARELEGFNGEGFAGRAAGSKWMAVDRAVGPEGDFVEICTDSRTLVKQSSVNVSRTRVMSVRAVRMPRRRMLERPSLTAAPMTAPRRKEATCLSCPAAPRRRRSSSSNFPHRM